MKETNPNKYRKAAKFKPSDAFSLETRDYSFLVKGGRDDKYRPEYASVARKLMTTGCTRVELAADLGISVATLYTWMRKYGDFAEAIRAGHDMCDNRVELSLYEKAVGYRWTETVRSKKINECGEEVEDVTEIDKQMPPDNSAIIFWLKNRRSHKWKDRHEMTINNNINVLTSSDLQQLLLTHADTGELIEGEVIKE